MYEPTLARFMSRDPLLENGVEVLSPVPDMREHPYVYAGNSPVSFSDPSGLARECSGCCKVKSLTVDPATYKCSVYKNSVTRQTVFSAKFGVSAEFVDDAKHDCGCCTYQQRVKGYIRQRIGNGAWVYGKQPDGSTMNYDDFVEDCVHHPDGTTQCYGNRTGAKRTSDDYSEPDRLSGCKYKNSDEPGVYGILPAVQRAIQLGVQAHFEIKLTFEFKINDHCCVGGPTNRLPTTTYAIDCKMSAPNKK